MKKIKIYIIILFLFISLCGCANNETKEDNKIRIGITLYDQYDTFLSEMINVINENVTNDKGIVALTVKDAEKSQSKQDQQVQTLIEEGCDVICVNLTDRTSPTKIIDLAKKNDVPIIFFNRELVAEDLQRWDRLYYVGAPAEQSGEMEGEIAADAIKDNPSSDKNGDGIIQYYVLEGEMGHQDAIVRSEYSVNTLEEQGITIERLNYGIANWNRAQAQTKIAQAINEFGNSIELILSNNDDMALGAIDAYKAAGIKEEDFPIIIGTDGTQVGLEAIKEGTLTGTVFNDGIGQANAMYKLAKALATNDSLNGLGLKDRKYIRIDYQKITSENVDDFFEQ